MSSGQSFLKRYKYPRTPHLPFSNPSDDDLVLRNDSNFHSKRVVVTTKMDGENMTVYPDGFCHTRSIDSQHKPYQSWMINFIQTWAYQLPEHYRVCGEYLYAQHSIYYDDLPSYFLVFSVWKKDKCLSWDDTINFCASFNLQTVPVLYEGLYNSNLIQQLAKEIVLSQQEGIVVRNSNSFLNFQENVAKFVRPNHIQTTKNWYRNIVVNRLDNEGK